MKIIPNAMLQGTLDRIIWDDADLGDEPYFSWQAGPIPGMSHGVLGFMIPLADILDRMRGITS